jgi:hypothetical protein
LPIQLPATFEAIGMALPQATVARDPVVSSPEASATGTFPQWLWG